MKKIILLFLVISYTLFAELVIITEPSAMVYWNGNLIDVVPLNGILKISNITYPGKLKIVKPGYSVYETVVSSDATLNIKLTLPSYVEITTEPEGVKVYINDKFYGLTPAVFEVPSGNLRIFLEKDGYIFKTMDLFVSPSKINKVKVKLKKYVDLKINVKEKVRAIFNGKLVTLPIELKVLPGKYNLELLDSDYVNLNQEVVVPSVENYEYNVDETKFARLYVYGYPENAEVSLENVSKISPASFRVIPGKYSLTIRKDGYRELKSMIVLKSGSNNYVYNLKTKVISKTNEDLLFFLDGMKVSESFVAKRLYFTKIVGQGREWYGFTDGSIEKMPESYSIILGREGSLIYKGIKYDSPVVINAKFSEIITYISETSSNNFTVVGNLIIDDENHCVVNVYSEDSMEVFINDKFFGKTPLYFLILPRGIYRFRFVKDGIIVSEKSIEIKQGILNEVFGGD
ncbi:hypothetical protein SU69_07780 [Thermosipho melanesiensis]|uniref:PEGA domain protein n=2 Tax=Thermosipho melanesiensis TaxID=46541 RepID=A6LN76_THEM4|nr:PEGA domain-containing protein [Thermosipho melanesiensis]ABR31377.1 PEGA domain protein [Thermosipho melanesiensis BI429]APT74437.1 hypothetical protein BW47_08135 [Thermosipho melanesiensis]OOC36399.1 hypothetical protein SU68_07850 [Thermosipho melanesiensis]OOC37217.1 hypothetical protein SU69_07780 [Thermosipho melanesiensis]OOC37969.1 hypothetical protein SU70_07790 [Thermosipho melanesiensis]